MLKERENVLRRLTMIIDAAVLVASFFLAYCIRVNFHTFYSLDIFPSKQVVLAPLSLERYIPVMILWAALWLFMLLLNGMYKSLRTKPFLDITWINIKAAFLGLVSFGSMAFVLKVEHISRVLAVLFILIGFFLLLLEKWVQRKIISHIRQKGYNTRKIIIVGTGQRAGNFINTIRKHAEWGYEIIGLIDDDRAKMEQKFFGYRVIGLLDDLPDILSNKIVDEVVFIVPRQWLDKIQKSIAACETLGIKAHVAADLFNLQIAKAFQTDLEGMPLLTFESTFIREWQLLVKRLFDFFATLFGILILSPLLLITAILIKLTSPGPVFYRQKRVTLNGRIFTLLKFRSMYKDAHQRLAELQDKNEMDGPVFKMKNDPRITPLGRFLRRASIDELPQLFNVFMGQMSLVGPRPPIPEEVQKYELWQRRRLSMRPGITCLWQISGRNEVSFEQWMEMDMLYIDEWSLMLDFKILLKTIPAVIWAKGAR